MCSFSDQKPKFFNSLVLAASLDKWLAEGRRDNIDFERQYIHFRPDITKTGEGRISPLIEPARSELLALKEGACGIQVYSASAFTTSGAKMLRI
jgi:hypothetical protein